MKFVNFKNSEHDELWDSFCLGAPMATFLHSRKFLAYHKDRFDDRSLIIENEKERIIGVFPAAVDPASDAVVVSHPGSTFGGLVHDRSLLSGKLEAAFLNICEAYRKMNFEKLHYKATPYIYQDYPSSDDLYVLFRLGAKRFQCDLSAAINVQFRPKLSERRRRCLKKATRAGVSVASGLSYLDELWKIIVANLEDKHEAQPVHSLEEINLLCCLFPNEIKIVCGILDKKVIAGTILFLSSQVVHSQYIASSSIGYDVSALDMVFEDCIEYTKSSGRRYFDFGISNERNGIVLNEGLYKFKTEFGAGGVLHEFYEIDLRRPSGYQGL